MFKSNIFIKWFHSIPFPPCCSQTRLLIFHSFSFLYLKTSNQGYLIPFHSILFHSFVLLKYIPFNSFPFPYYYSISFHSLPLWTPKRSIKLPNKGKSFPFPLLKLPNKGIEEYSKIIFFILFYSIPFLPPKRVLSRRERNE